jgi:hypothetical protein
MPKLVQIAMLGITTLVTAAVPVAPGVEPAPARVSVREVADSALRDVAVAVYRPTKSVIYYNPVLMARLGPELESFFMAHEYAHIDLRHTRSGALGSDASTRHQTLRQKELEADCLAATRLASSRREAALAAVRFFARMGDTSYDAEHPNGTERAATILHCLSRVE